MIWLTKRSACGQLNGKRRSRPGEKSVTCISEFLRLRWPTGISKIHRQIPCSTAGKSSVKYAALFV